MKTVATWIGLIFGVAAMVLQFVLAMQARIGSGDTVFGALIYCLVVELHLLAPTDHHGMFCGPGAAFPLGEIGVLVGDAWKSLANDKH